MKEIVFLNTNISKWKKYESVLQHEDSIIPDQLASLYIQLTDDLAYARTYFPNSKTTDYLNLLAQKSYRLIYQNKKVKKKSIFTFWVQDYPLIVRDSWRYIIYSFLIFFISVFIGAISAKYDQNFVRLILGDGYVNMTLENIEKGDPLAVYKQANEVDMFLGITLNNIKVSFLVFVFGVLFSVGSGFMLFQNGVMLGSFQYFFIQKSLFLESSSVIWIHGTLEIFAIIVAGAAGLVMGNSILFPGTYKRIQSFRNGVVKGIKLVSGLIPVFILAGFLEGFITRYTEMSYFIKFGIISISLLIIILYFIIYPHYLYKQKTKTHGKSIY